MKRLFLLLVLLNDLPNQANENAIFTRMLEFQNKENLSQYTIEQLKNFKIELLRQISYLQIHQRDFRREQDHKNVASLSLEIQTLGLSLTSIQNAIEKQKLMQYFTLIAQLRERLKK